MNRPSNFKYGHVLEAFRKGEVVKRIFGMIFTWFNCFSRVINRITNLSGILRTHPPSKKATYYYSLFPDVTCRLSRNSYKWLRRPFPLSLYGIWEPPPQHHEYQRDTEFPSGALWLSGICSGHPLFLSSLSEPFCSLLSKPQLVVYVYPISRFSLPQTPALFFVNSLAASVFHHRPSCLPLSLTKDRIDDEIFRSSNTTL